MFHHNKEHHNSVMRKIFPLKPVQHANESSAPKLTAEKEKGQNKNSCRSSQRRDERVTVVEAPGRCNVRGLKENSLGTYLRREHMSPFRPHSYGEENDPYLKREKRSKINSKHDVSIEIEASKRSQTPTTPTIFTSVSCQGKLKADARKLQVDYDQQRHLAPSTLIDENSSRPRSSHFKSMKRSCSMPRYRSEEMTLDLEGEALQQKPSSKDECQLDHGNISESVIGSSDLTQSVPSARVPEVVRKQSRLLRSHSSTHRVPKDSVSSSVSSCTNLSKSFDACPVEEKQIKSVRDNLRQHFASSIPCEKKEIINCTYKCEAASIADASEPSVAASEFRYPPSCIEEISYYRSHNSTTGAFSDDQCSFVESSSSIIDSGKFLPLFRERRVDREVLRLCPGNKENFKDTNEALESRAREQEQQAQSSASEIELMKPYNELNLKDISKKAEIYSDLLQEKVRRLLNENHGLCLQLASEMRSRVSERRAANEALRIVKEETGKHVHLIEKEKNALQNRLEKELDRRTKEWGIELERIKAEEKRLRNRVRELAEKNVSLQREVSSFYAKETETGGQVKGSDILCTSLKTKMKEAQNEIAQLKQSLADSQTKEREAEEKFESIRTRYDAKEKENHALQKTTATLQRFCNDQERTIRGLLQSINDEIHGVPQATNNHLATWQLEGSRLISSQHKEISFHSDEIDRDNSRSSAFLKLDQELWSLVDYLQNQAISIIDESNLLSRKLLDIMRVSSGDKNGNQILLQETTAQNLERKAESFRKHLQSTIALVKEKLVFFSNEDAKQRYSVSNSLSLEYFPLEIRKKVCEVMDELTAERMLSKLIRDKLNIKEAEVGRLKEHAVTMARNQELLGTESLQFQSLLGSASQRMADLEAQLITKDQTLNNLETELEKCLKEQEILKRDLVKAVQDRNLLAQDAERFNWEIQRLSAELENFRKKTEKLEELVLIRDGEITILRETYAGSLDNMSE